MWLWRACDASASNKTDVGKEGLDVMLGVIKEEFLCFN